MSKEDVGGGEGGGGGGGEFGQNLVVKGLLKEFGPKGASWAEYHSVCQPIHGNQDKIILGKS